MPMFYNNIKTYNKSVNEEIYLRFFSFFSVFIISFLKLLCTFASGYKWDVPNSKGGVRGVIPSKQKLFCKIEKLLP